MLRIHQPLAVIVKHLAEYLPHHVGAVGVEEFHAPPFPRWREAAQHQQLGIGWQKRLQRVPLHGYIIVRHSDCKNTKKIFQCKKHIFLRIIIQNIKGFSARNLQCMTQFYCEYNKGLTMIKPNTQPMVTQLNLEKNTNPFTSLSF